MTYNNEIFDGKLVDRSFTSKIDIARKNALILIAKNLNKAKKRRKKIEKNIKVHMSLKNVVNVLFKHDDKSGKHLGTYSIQCLNAMVLKTFGKKPVKCPGKHKEFTLRL